MSKKLIKKFLNPSGNLDVEMYPITEDNYVPEETKIVKTDKPKFVEIEDEYLPPIITRSSSNKSILDWRQHHLNNTNQSRKTTVDPYALWMNKRGDLVNENLNSIYNTNASTDITNNMAGRWLANADTTPEKYIDVNEYQDDPFLEEARRDFNTEKYGGLVNGIFKTQTDFEGNTRKQILYPTRKDSDTGKIIPISDGTRYEENIHAAQATGLEQTAQNMIDADIAKQLGLDINNRENWSYEDLQRFDKAKDPYYGLGEEFYAKRTKAGILLKMDAEKRNWNDQELENIYKANPNNEFFKLFFGEDAIYSKDLLRDSFNKLAKNDSFLLPDVYMSKYGNKLIKKK